MTRLLRGVDGSFLLLLEGCADDEEGCYGSGRGQAGDVDESRSVINEVDQTRLSGAVGAGRRGRP